MALPSGNMISEFLSYSQELYARMTKSPIVKRLLLPSRAPTARLPWINYLFGNRSILGTIVSLPMLGVLSLTAIAISASETTMGKIIDLFDIRPTLKNEVRNTVNARIDEIAAIAILSTVVITAALIFTRRR